MATNTPGCVKCGRDNDNGTHAALEATGHLAHSYDPGPIGEVSHEYGLRYASHPHISPDTVIIAGHGSRGEAEAMLSIYTPENRERWGISLAQRRVVRDGWEDA